MKKILAEQAAAEAARSGPDPAEVSVTRSADLFGRVC